MPSLCTLEEIDPEYGKEVSCEMASGPRYLALFRNGGAVRAYLNTCPHQGRPLNWAPDRFLLGDDGHLICPHHGATFDIDSGDCVSGPCKGAALTAVEVVVEDGEVVLVNRKS